MIEAAGIEKGERYKVGLTNRCLGTRWWTFGDAEDEGMKNVRFVQRGQGVKEPEDREGTDEQGGWSRGELPDELALVVEGEDEGAVEFEIV